MQWKERIDQLKSKMGKKKLQYALIGIVIAAILGLYFWSMEPSSVQKSGEDASDTNVSVEELEERLSRVLSQVEGAGKVEVVINYESTPELVPAMSSDTQSKMTQEEDGVEESKNERTEIATIQNGSNSAAVILKEKQPNVMGVIVVSEGASDIAVRMSLLSAITTVMDVDASRVEILKMQQQGS